MRTKKGAGCLHGHPQVTGTAWYAPCLLVKSYAVMHCVCRGSNLDVPSQVPLTTAVASSYSTLLYPALCALTSLYTFQLLLQVGTFADVVVADAIVKGVKGFDLNTAREAILKDVRIV